MDISQSYYQLVRDAVAQRRMGGQGCFVWNTDSLRLREIGEVVLPDIEQVLLREVLTNSPSPSEVFSSRFPGGTRRSFRSLALSNICSFRSAGVWNERNFRGVPPLNNSSVSREANDRIIYRVSYNASRQRASSRPPAAP